MRQKRIIALALVLVLFVLAVTACSKKDDPSDTQLPSETESETAEETLPDATTTTIPVTRAIYPVLQKDAAGGEHPETYTHLIAEHGTRFDLKNAKRISNLELACAAINDIVLQPGEIFSFNQIVGKRTEARGYQEASIIVNDAYENGLGGGVCQVASTLFYTVLLANLQPVERGNHSLIIPYAPAGFDAAVQWPWLDFQFKNNQSYPVKLKMFIRAGSVLVAQIYAQQKVDVGNVTFTSGQENGVYWMNRYVNGTLNYTCKSKYNEEKTTAAS